jgi:SAM-dependent methyltransferase
VPPSHGGSRRFKSYSAHHPRQTNDDPFAPWFAALETRQLATLSFREVRRAVQALSSLYVERRGRLAEGKDLDSAGKRAAFALYFAPIHFLLVREVVRALGAAEPPPAEVLDLGCGTGAAGAAWALEAGGGTTVEGVDRSAWAVAEARWTLATLRLRGRVRRRAAEAAPLPGRRGAVIAAFTANELTDDARAVLLPRLLQAGRDGARLLVVEPIARRLSPWWAEWAAAFREVGGREDTWAFPATLPARLGLLDHASGLDHSELKGRSLWLPAPAIAGRRPRG